LITPEQQAFLEKAYAAAVKAAHVFPAMAASEAALESTWGTSQLALLGNNLFGAKQQVHPEFATIHLPTREFLNHAWTTVDAAWCSYPDFETSFFARMDTLRRLAPTYPHYAFAVEAKDPWAYIHEVSQSWSTDPDRADKVGQIYRLHAASLEATA
jgi:flagellum-specific peptidoglycan hydrolase FlgJ